MYEFQAPAIQRAIGALEAGKNLALVSPTGSGKCLKIGTKVIKYSGETVAVESVAVGDQLLGPDGTPRNVLSVTRGMGPLYRVTPRKGPPYVVNGAHLLSVVWSPDGKDARGGTRSTVRADSWASVSTTARHRMKGWRSPPVYFAPAGPVPFDAYCLGLWLGDGSRSCTAITKSVTDTPVLDAWRELASRLGARIREYTHPSSPDSITLFLTYGCGSGSKNVLRRYIRSEGLYRAKRVPAAYLTASRSDRAALLAGLLDTDGCLSKSGFDFISVYPQLSDDVVFLARSLGLAAYVSSCVKRCQNGFSGTYYRVSISGHCHTIPTRLPRKQAPRRRQKKDALRVGITVEPMGDGEYAGFTLDGDHLFLLADFTVTHNSFMEGAVHRWGADKGLVTIVPNLDIGRGIYDKQYASLAGLSDTQQMRYCEEAGIWTVMRLHNELMAARITPPRLLQFDEMHHTTAATYTTLMALCGHPPMVGWGATFYRGTPDETAKLRATWGEPYIALSEREAVTRGIISQPDFVIWPLLNDDLIKVENGEFQTKSVEGALEKVDVELCDRIRTELCEGGRPKRPTIIFAPGVMSARRLTNLLHQTGVSTVCITGEETHVGGDYHLTRSEGLARAGRGEAILVQVKVVGEGVDLPLRVCVDCAPTMSPVRWMQGPVGRIRRPSTDGKPLYIGTNHNLTRHAYLLGGLIPAGQIKQAQTAWGPDYKPARRSLARAIGLEGFGKFTVSTIPLLDGSYASLYALQTSDGTHQYAVLLHPCVADPMIFERSNPHTGETKTNAQGFTYKVKDYGPWKRIRQIPNLDGYVSVKPGHVTETMMKWWTRSAERCGLDPGFVPNAREFVALPVLANSGTRFKVE